jgi:hypothetical protein
MAGGRGQRGQVLKEEVPYHEHNIQDVMIEDLQRQVAELTQRLAAQNLEMYCDIDGRNSESNFENPYHKPVLVREQRVRDEWHENLGFKVGLSKIYGTLTSLTIVSKSQAHLPNLSHVKEEDKFIEEDFSVDWVSPLIYDIYPDEDDLLKEVSFVVNTENFIEENNNYDVFDESHKFEGFNLEVEEIDLVDFLGVDNILSNSLDDGGFDQFYLVDENIVFKTEEIANPLWEIFMACERKKINEECVKIELSQANVRNFRSTIHNQVVMGCKLFLFQHQVMFMLRNTAWKGLIGHPKDRGKNHQTDYLQPGQDDLNSGTNSFPTWGD